MEKLYHGNTNQSKSDLAILLDKNKTFRQEALPEINRDILKEVFHSGRYYNFKAKQKWMELDKFTIIAGDFNIPLSS